MAGYTLNEVRLDAHERLGVKTRVYDPTPGDGHLQGGEEFAVIVVVRNSFEPGGGGGAFGDAHFKNVIADVQGTAYTQLLTSKGGTPIDGNKRTYRFNLGPDNALVEGEKRRLWLWFRAIAEAPHLPDQPEQVARINVRADFDIQRYFTVRYWRKPTYDIDIHEIVSA